MKDFRTYLTKIDGCKVIETPSFVDERGSLSVVFNEKAFLEAGLPTHWAQENVSTSSKGVFRGLHLQRNNPQGKLVQVVHGEILDVCVDLRPHSPTFRKIERQYLRPHGRAFYLPPGTAHGFLALTDQTVVHYMCTTPYDPVSDCGISIFDPAIDFRWPDHLREPLLSERDKKLPTLAEFLVG